MRRLSKYLPALLLFCGITTLSAAPATGPASPGTGSGSAAPAAPAVPTSIEAMQVKVVAIQAQLEDDTRMVMHLKDVARKQKDVIKLNCVNDRLVELKAQRNIADAIQLSLAKAGDDWQQLYVQLAGVSENVRSLREQANSCIGEPELFKQESGVEVHRPEIPDDPNNTSFEPGFEAPGYASAFQ